VYAMPLALLFILTAVSAAAALASLAFALARP
jgi:hypothetical protein